MNTVETQETLKGIANLQVTRAGEGVVTAREGNGSLRGAQEGRAELREDAYGALQVSAHSRLPRRAAQDDFGQDPAQQAVMRVRGGY